MFDWERFLDAHNIEWTRAHRFASSHVIAINCPFCYDDPSFHLGISDLGRGFHCWREPTPGSHSGRSPHKLIMRLLNCSYEEANAIVAAEGHQFVGSDHTFAADILRKLTPMREPDTPTELRFPPGYHRIVDSLRAQRLYYPYLEQRGYSRREAERLSNSFDLHYEVKGPFAYRIIIPVRHQGKLVSWTGRAIDDNTVRYKSLSHNPETAAKAGTPVAVCSIKACLLDYDDAHYGGNTLVVTEGPFDAMRVTMLGENYDIHAVALFGKNITQTQIELLRHLVPRYKRTVSLLDQDTGNTAFGLFPEDLRVECWELPKGIKDPAMLDDDSFATLFRKGNQ